MPPLYSQSWVLVLTIMSTPKPLYSTQVFKYSPVITWGPDWDWCSYHGWWCWCLEFTVTLTVEVVRVWGGLTVIDEVGQRVYVGGLFSLIGREEPCVLNTNRSTTPECDIQRSSNTESPKTDTERLSTESVRYCKKASTIISVTSSHKFRTILIWEPDKCQRVSFVASEEELFPYPNDFSTRSVHMMGFVWGLPPDD